MNTVHLQPSPFPHSSRVVECGFAGLRIPRLACAAQFDRQGLEYPHCGAVSATRAAGSGRLEPVADESGAHRLVTTTLCGHSRTAASCKPPAPYLSTIASATSQVVQRFAM